MVLHVQSTQISRVDNPCVFFLNVFFSYQMCIIPFWKLERNLTLMIRRAKGLELMKIIFMTHLNTFASKVLLTLKIMNFEIVASTKVVHIYIW